MAGGVRAAAASRYGGHLLLTLHLAAFLSLSLSLSLSLFHWRVHSFCFCDCILPAWKQQCIGCSHCEHIMWLSVLGATRRHWVWLATSPRESISLHRGKTCGNRAPASIHSALERRSPAFQGRFLCVLLLSDPPSCLTATLWERKQPGKFCDGGMSSAP